MIILFSILIYSQAYYFALSAILLMGFYIIVIRNERFVRVREKIKRFF